MPICAPCSHATASRSRCRSPRCGFTSTRASSPGRRCTTSANLLHWSWPTAGNRPRMPQPWSSSTCVPCPPCSSRAPASPKARLDCPDNLVAHWVVEYGDVERAFAGAVHRMSEHFRIHKGGGHSIEARGVLARFDATDELLTVWDSTQMPHKTKRVLVEALGLSEERVRVIAP